MERFSEEAPKVLEDHLGRRLSSTVRNTLCPDSFAGTRARTRLTEAVRSLHPPSSTHWSLLVSVVFHVSKLTRAALDYCQKRYMPPLHSKIPLAAYPNRPVFCMSWSLVFMSTGETARSAIGLAEPF